MTKSRSGGGWLDCPKIWPGWGGAPKGTRRGLPHGALTDGDLLELYKALYGYRWGEPLQCVPDQEGRVSMPATLFVKLCWLVDWNIAQLPWTQEQKDWLRAAYVAQERAAGKTSLSKAYEAAAKRLTDGEIVRGLKVEPSPAAAGAESIKKSYQKVMPSPRKPSKRKLLLPR
jgi:hypothetical protein